MWSQRWLWGSVASVAVALGCSPDPVPGGPPDVGSVDGSVDTGTTDGSTADVGSDATTDRGPGMDAPDASTKDAAVGDGAVGDGAGGDGAGGDGAVGDGAAGDVPVACADGGTSCGGACVDTRSSLAHCGGCDMACSPANGTGSCTAGVCALMACNAGFADCNGMASDGCEANLNTTAAHCGSCGRACTATNAMGACASGVCGVGACNAGFGDCNDNASDGCETDINATVASCGACGTACAIPRATEACAAGRCAVGTCNEGFADCDSTAANGCETTLGTNTNCGGCGMACAGGTRCSAGACVSSCPAGTTYCSAPQICVNTQTDVSNCGACGNACPVPANGTATCSAGACGVSCDSGFANCDTMNANGCEVNLNTSAASCSTCGRACALANSTAVCSAGSCTVGACAAGFADCNSSPGDGCETNLNTTAAACGACGTACSLAHATASCAGGRCAVAACSDGFADCNANPADGCETPTTTNSNCGACGTACTAGTRCAGTSCVSSCPAGTTYCAATGVCANFDTDTANCGMCGTVCPGVAGAVPACNSRACGFECNAGFADCDGVPANGCEVNLGTSITHCQSCGNACTLPNARAACSTSGCVIAGCNAGYSDCNGNPADGCEVNLTSSPTACGSCTNVCSVANGAATCTAGICGIAMCTPGYGNCDGVYSNGCEAPLNTSANCGVCGTGCSAGSFCSAGVCVSSCGASTMYCGAQMACFNLLSDVGHCGSCTTACTTPPSATPTCSAGACGLACNAGFADCNGSAADGCEVNIATSPASCGSCGSACTLASAINTCTSGSCSIGSCSAGYGNCNGTTADGCEVNLNTAVTSCGSCGTTCALANATSGCTSGACSITSCNAGYGNCNGTTADGCERQLNTNTNCGVCGRACSAGQVCSGGVCASACTAGTSYCAATGSCVNLSTNPDNCGSCGNVCPTYPRTSRVCAGGTCSSTCNSGFANCDGSASNGCETNINDSVLNCGRCSNRCMLANATPVCSSGACAISSCNFGHANCNGTTSDGCEANLANSNSNCGTCGNTCTGGRTCRLGACRF